MNGIILQPSNGPEDWQRHLAEPQKHWKKGRSAMEAALSWEQAEGLPTEIAAILPESTLLQAIVEYPVDLPGGGNASKNDVFALVADSDGLIVCMIEAKRDEPFGPLLSDWLVDASAGKQARLRAICDCLGLEQTALPGSIRYQLLHRTASAVLTARTYRTMRAAMIVQSFSPARRWIEDFEAFASLFGAVAKDGEPTDVVLPSGISLRLGWACAPLSPEIPA